MIEGCVSWYQWFAPKARLEFADDSTLRRYSRLTFGFSRSGS
jgi:hypothetical protein